MRLLDKIFGRKKNNPEATNAILDYFKVEHRSDETLVLGHYADKDFSDWLRGIHAVIQEALATKLFQGNKVKNYFVITSYIGGQQVEIAIVKDGKQGPHAQLEKLKRELSEREGIGCTE